MSSNCSGRLKNLFVFLVLLASADQAHADLLGDLVSKAIKVGGEAAIRKMTEGSQAKTITPETTLQVESSPVVSTAGSSDKVSMAYKKSGAVSCQAAKASTGQDLAEFLELQKVDEWKPHVIRFVVSVSSRNDRSFFVPLAKSLEVLEKDADRFEKLTVIVGGRFHAFYLTRENCTWSACTDCLSPGHQSSSSWMKISERDLVGLVGASAEDPGVIMWPEESGPVGDEKSPSNRGIDAMTEDFRSMETAMEEGPAKDRQAAMAGRGYWEKAEGTKRHLPELEGLWQSPKQRKWRENSLKLGPDGHYEAREDGHIKHKGRYAAYRDKEGIWMLFEVDHPMGIAEFLLEEKEDMFLDFRDFGAEMKKVTN
jgi:hypothetical protein